MERLLTGHIASQRGVAYLGALMTVMVIGIILGITGQSWKSIMQREREEELLFRGMQIRDALARWHVPVGAQHVATPLNDLNHLLKDPRTPATIRHLRRLYQDPVSGKDWLLIREPGRGIVGIHSPSTARPVKQDNFPDELKEFAGKEQYKDWKFVVMGAQQPVVPAVMPGLPKPAPVATSVK